MTPALVRCARFFHRSAALRRLARSLGRGFTVRQRFHHGVICLDAVDHSWSWIGGRPLETFDRDVQDRLLALVRPRGRFIDVGCNVGVMTLSVLLRDAQARAVCVDPNARAIALLGASLRRNGCADRATLVNAALSARETSLGYAGDGSFIGHVSATASPVAALPLADLVAQHVNAPVVLKIDIEGYEALLADALARLTLPAGSVMLLELHPEGFNGMGAPRLVLDGLARAPGLRIQTTDSQPPATLDPAAFHQVEVHWPA